MSAEIVKSVWNNKLTLKEIVEWHLENAELSEINNEYDRGWYDCLKMIHKYVLENEQSNLPDRNHKVSMTEIRTENF